MYETSGSVLSILFIRLVEQLEKQFLQLEDRHCLFNNIPAHWNIELQAPTISRPIGGNFLQNLSRTHMFDGTAG